MHLPLLFVPLIMGTAASICRICGLGSRLSMALHSKKCCSPSAARHHLHLRTLLPKGGHQHVVCVTCKHGLV